MTNKEFKTLMNLKKSFVKDSITLPANTEKETFEIKSLSTKDEFFLDIDRGGRIELSKFKLQNRYAKTKQPLVQIEIDSPPHINPDGTRKSRNHIHVFRETDNDTGNLPWAYDLDEFEEINLINIDVLNFTQVFFNFCAYCNIKTDDIQGII